MGYQSHAVGLWVVGAGAFIAVPSLVGVAWRFVRQPTREQAAPVPHEPLAQSSDSKQITSLLSKVQSASEPLAKSIPEVLELAHARKDTQLETFARRELSGWPALAQDDPNAPQYRQVQAFLSWNPINMGYVGFHSSADALNFMVENPDTFTPRTLTFTQPVAQIESKAIQPSHGLLSFNLKAKDVIPNTMQPDAIIYAYTNGNAWERVREGIRTEITNRLLALLPSVGVDQ
jgi:hypothetical protein